MAQRASWLAVPLVAGAFVGLVTAGAVFSSGDRLVAPGIPAPGFEAVNVRTGKTVTLDALGGDVVLLNIWATWCRPCEEEVPSMQRLYEELGPDGLRVVAVSIDTDRREKVLQWIEARDLTFDVLHDPRGKIKRLYQTTGVPESFVIDRNGVIVRRQIGAYEWDQPPVVALVRRLLSAAAPGS